MESNSNGGGEVQQTDTEKTKERADQLDGLILRVSGLVNAFSSVSNQLVSGLETVKCQSTYWKHIAAVEENYAAV